MKYDYTNKYDKYKQEDEYDDTFIVFIYVFGMMFALIMLVISLALKS